MLNSQQEQDAPEYNIYAEREQPNLTRLSSLIKLKYKISLETKFLAGQSSAGGEGHANIIATKVQTHSDPRMPTWRDMLCCRSTENSNGNPNSYEFK